MSNCRPKQLKFAGEDSFIVQKPGTKKYLMAVAQEPDVLVKQNAINKEVVPMDNITITNPTEVASDVVVATPPVMITSPNWESLTCAQIQSEIDSIRSMLMVSRFSDPNVYQAYQDIIAKGEFVYAQKCTKTQLPSDVPPSEVPPAPPVYVEPTWDSLTCDQIKQEIANIQSILPSMTNEEQRQILMMSYKNGTRAFERCNVSETPLEPTPLPPAPPNLPSETTTTTTSGGGGVGAPPITTITTTGTPIIATATAGGLTSSGMPKPLGGGGGGGGAKEEPKAPKKETGLNLWWLVAAAAGLYLITRKD